MESTWIFYITLELIFILINKLLLLLINLVKSRLVVFIILIKFLDESFISNAPTGSVVGVQASGSFQWFEKMLFELNFELKIGNPWLIRKMALAVHKSDQRDAEHILDLLITNRFPEVKQRSEKSQIILAWLNYRDSLVRQRTAIANQLQAMARSARAGSVSN